MWAECSSIIIDLPGIIPAPVIIRIISNDTHTNKHRPFIHSQYKDLLATVRSQYQGFNQVTDTHLRPVSNSI